MDKNIIMGARKPRGRWEKYLILHSGEMYIKAGAICHYTFTYFKSFLYCLYIEQMTKKNGKDVT